MDCTISVRGDGIAPPGSGELAGRLRPRQVSTRRRPRSARHRPDAGPCASVRGPV